MNPRDNPSQSRANEVWKRFVGMFGGPAVERKFGLTPPPEWVAMMGRLNDFQIDRGIRRLAYNGARDVPSLPQFTSLCRAIGGDDLDEGPQQRPALPAPDDYDGDPWLMAANRYLLGHIVKRVTADPQCYGRGASFQMLRAREEDLRKLGIDKHNLDASPEFIANVHRLVAAKNAWADDMRDLAVDGGVPVETQKAVWHDWIGRAEAQIRESQASRHC